MRISFYFKNTTPTEEQQVQEYFSKKEKKLAKFLSHFPEDGAHLHITCKKYDKHSAYDIEMKLQFASEVLIAQEASHTITKAVDLAKDRLEMQIKKYDDIAHREHRTLRSRESLKRKVGASPQL